jgi:hypothetical protein
MSHPKFNLWGDSLYVYDSEAPTVDRLVNIALVLATGISPTLLFPPPGEGIIILTVFFGAKRQKIRSQNFPLLAGKGEIEKIHAEH